MSLSSTCLAIWSRDYSGESKVLYGRPKMAISLRCGALSNSQSIAVRTIFEIGFLSIARAIVYWLYRCLRGYPLPLQCLLYGDPCEIRRICMHAKPYSNIYIDGIRLFLVAERLSKLGLRIIVDDHDSLSQRAKFTLGVGEGITLGFLNESVPSWIKHSVKWFGRIILRYEYWSLTRTERRLVKFVHRVVLLNHKERICYGGGSVDPIKLCSIAFPQTLQNEIVHPPNTEWRLIFVGSSELLQNRLALEFIGRCLCHAPMVTVYWYGGGDSLPDQPSNLIRMGFVSDLIGSAYVSGSILLCPVVLDGGIKTKVLEALSYGIPVACSPSAIEGLGWPDYPLTFSELEHWITFMCNPDIRILDIQSSIRIGRNLIMQIHNPEIVKLQWHSILFDT